MDVKAISNSQPSFNGYLSKNLVNYVNTVVKREIAYEVETASMASKSVDVTRLKQISSLGHEVIRNFTNYMSKFHKNTFLDVKYGFLEIKNSIIKTSKINVYTSEFEKEPTLFEKGHIALPSERRTLNDIQKASIYDLKTLKIMSELLPKIDSKNIDSMFINFADSKLKSIALETTMFFKKIRLRNWASKIDKYSADLGIENTAKIRVEEYFKSAKTAKDLAKENVKIQNQLEKDNDKIAKEILKG